MIKDAIRATASAEYARRSLRGFIERTMPGFDIPRHVDYLIPHLEELERGEATNLMTNQPPRHAKSLLCSRLFPAWCIGRNPQRRIILASGDQELSEGNSRAIRSLIMDELWPFPDVKLRQDSTSVKRWDLVNGGGLFATSVEGEPAGRGATMLVLDDLAKTSGTEGYRANIMRFYREDLVSRLEGKNPLTLAVGTRFHEDDFFGALLARAPEDWRHIAFRAIALEHDILGRQPGEALWPSHIPLRELLKRKKESGSRIFESQYQQNPVTEDGNLVKLDWFPRYDRLPAFEKITMSVDAASKLGASNDFTAIVVIGSTRSEHYVIDVQRRKVEYPDLVRMVIAAYEMHRPSVVYVEDAANAVGLIQQLKEQSHLPIVAVKTIGSKLSRVEAATGVMEARKVILPKESSWLLDLESELLAFDNGKHDDMVDAMAMALNQLSKAQKFIGIICEFGAADGSFVRMDGTVIRNGEVIPGEAVEVAEETSSFPAAETQYLVPGGSTAQNIASLMRGIF